MTEQPDFNLSPTEWKIMKIVWNLKSCSAREIHQATERQYGMTLTTTKTLLHRLLHKGHLKVREVGNSYLYEPVSVMMDTLVQAADELLENTGQGTTASLMMHLVKEERLSGEELLNLRRLLDEYDDKIQPRGKSTKKDEVAI